MQQNWFRPIIFFLSVCILIGGWFFVQEYITKKSESIGAEKPMQQDVPAAPRIASPIPTSVSLSQDTASDAIPVYPLMIGTNIISVELANTAALQESGLSNRSSLSADRGMLFAYRSPGRYSFWMKDMRFPLDFIWIDEKYTVVDIAQNISPDTFPQAIAPKVPVPYVLEVNAGYIKKSGISIGDAVDVSQILPLK